MCATSKTEEKKKTNRNQHQLNQPCAKHHTSIWISFRFDLKKNSQAKWMKLLFFPFYSSEFQWQVAVGCCSACVLDIFVFDNVKMPSGFEMVELGQWGYCKVEDDGRMIKVTWNVYVYALFWSHLAGSCQVKWLVLSPMCVFCWTYTLYVVCSI